MTVKFVSPLFSGEKVKEEDFEEFEITADDLKNLCFPANTNGFIIRRTKTLVTFSSAFTYNIGFQLFVWNISNVPDDDPYYYITGKLTTAAATDDMINAAKTVEDLFHESLDFLVQQKNPSSEMNFKFVHRDSPWMLMELYGLQDALFFARVDSNSPDPEIIFEQFVGNLNYWWVADLVGTTKALEMLREYFDKMLPIT